MATKKTAKKRSTRKKATGQTRRPKAPRDWTPAFLAALSKSPDVTAACNAAGIARQTAYNRFHADEVFAAAWTDAVEQAMDALDGEMYRRAYHGVERVKLHQGHPAGFWVDAKGEHVPEKRVADGLVPDAKFVPIVEREYSDSLAMFLARARRPDVYGDKKKVEHSGPNGAPVAVSFYLPSNGRDEPSGSPGDSAQ